MTDGGGTLWAERHHPQLPNDTHAGLGDNAHSVQTPHDPSYTSMYPPDHDYSTRYGGLSQDSHSEKPTTSSGLTTRESIELFQEAVDAAHDDQRKTLNGIDAPSDELKPKLTVDLRRRGLSSIPKEVVAIIKQDVERLHLAHNQLRSIAYEFSNCFALKYLNLRNNRFKEIPQAIFGLTQLQILEISRNRLTEVPDDIESMKALRVLSIQNNDIRDLPNCLGSITALKMLKLTGNPWEPGIKHILESGEYSPMQSPPVPEDDNERDTSMTTPVKEYLRGRAVKDSGEDASSSDEPLETPRAQSRFPVQPRIYGHSTSGSESASDLRSPGFIKPFPPGRSHHRIPSSHNNNMQTAVPRRPGLTPLTLGNERNRSNSEGFLQATQNNKAKRMGLVTKKTTELDVLEEGRTHRNSYHLRGQSHGSALRNGVRADEVSPSGPRGSDRLRGMAVRRLSSLPEQSRDEWPSDNIIEGARGVLYALHLVHPYIATMASVLKDGTMKASSMEGAYDAVAMHVERLDHELHKYDGMKDQSSEVGKRIRKSIISATQSCIVAHQHVGTVLLKSVKQIVRGVDPRYLRTLMLTFYGSLNEISNASRSLGNAQPRALVQRNNVQRVSTITEVPNEGERMSLRPNSVTPTQERQKPERQWRQGSIQQSNSYTNLQAAYGTQNPIPLYPNNRSRSNSRAGGLYSSASSSMVSTPGSADTFSLVARSRSGSVNITPEQARMEKQQAARFEKIYTVLNKATTEGLEVIRELDGLFSHGLDNAIRQRNPQRIRDLWSTLTDNGKYCVEKSDALKKRLSVIRLNDPEARNAPDFWQLVTDFINSYMGLLVSLKESRKHQLMPDDVRHWVRPIHASTREAAKLIAESPWNSLTTEADFQATPQPQLQTQLRAENGYQQHRAKTSGGSVAGSSSSPYTPSVPATPLSAALGPAAQATVPATPASAIEDSFAGNVWQRADTLQKNQTMFPSRR